MHLGVCSREPGGSTWCTFHCKIAPKTNTLDMRGRSRLLCIRGHWCVRATPTRHRKTLPFPRSLITKELGAWVRACACLPSGVLHPRVAAIRLACAPAGTDLIAVHPPAAACIARHAGVAGRAWPARSACFAASAFETLESCDPAPPTPTPFSAGADAKANQSSEAIGVPCTRTCVASVWGYHLGAW